MARIAEYAFGRAINMDHVHEVVRRKSGFALLDESGSSLGESTWSYDEFIEQQRPLVPARQGDVVLLVSCAVDTYPESTSRLYIEHWPVVAWRMERNSADPILPETPSSGDCVLIPLPGGGFSQPYVAVYQDLESAKAGILEQFQKDYEWRQKLANKDQNP